MSNDTGALGFQDRELWNAGTEALPAAARKSRAEAALAREWDRLWDLQIPFYQEKFAAAGLSRQRFPGLDAIPLTRKSELRADEKAHPVFGRHRAVGLDQAARIAASAGTTGKPWYIFYSREDLQRYRALNREHMWRVGLRPGSHFAHSWPGGIYPTGVLGGMNYDDFGVLELPLGIPFSKQDGMRHLEVWRDVGIDTLMCTISQLQTYDDAAQELGMDLPRLLEGKTLITSGEAIWQFPAGWQRLMRSYGFKRVHNISGASECPGLVTSDNVHHTGLVVPGDHYWIQVCDPQTGREVPAGQPGHLVVSSFGMDNFVLRYDLEDLVVLNTEPCPSGTTCQRYTILGRTADMALVQGRKLLPVDVQLALEDFGAPEFMMIAGAADALKLKVEGSGQAGERQHGLGAKLGVPVEIEEVPTGSLPRASFKPRRLS